MSLPAGRSEATLGAGRQPLWTCRNYKPDSAAIKHTCNEDGSGTEQVGKSEIFKGSVDYRLGVRDEWGPFPGVELQWHLEAPTNPATMEFGLNLGLPSGPSFRHKFGAGWGVGAWADNSFFAEYAISKRLGIPLFFGNFRATWLATQIGEVLEGDFSSPLPSHRRLIWQTGFGFVIRFPDWIAAPDFIAPQLNLTLPQIPSGERKFRRVEIPLAQWDMNLGIGWTF